jgi:membrane protease YdiL (CAAX protease family)
VNTLIQPPSARVPHLPHAAISPGIAGGCLLTGLAIALPAIYFVALLPLAAFDSASLDALAAQRTTEIFLRPGLIAVKALIAAPLLEEIVYRGLILQLLRRYTSPWLALLVANALFAITHVGSGVGNVVFAFVVGLFLSWLVIRSRSLYASMLCHSAINLCVVFALKPIFLAHGLSASDAMTHPLPLVLLAGSLGLLAAGIRMLRSAFNGIPAATTHRQLAGARA